MTAAGTNGAMVIPPTYAGTDTFTNPNGVKVTDLRTSGAQQTERSVKEFGAVCDGVTDDTNALQAALNYANAHGVALTIPQGTCKTQTLSWHGESIGGLGKQVSALMGFPGQDVLETAPDATNMLSYTRLHDLTIYVDQSEDVSCSPAEGRAAAGSCAENRPMETNSIFSPGGNGLTGTEGTGAAWSVGNCAIAMQATTGAGGNGLSVAEMENVEIATTGTDPMAAQYPGAHSTHTCGLYLAQWPQWSEFRNIDIRGLNTGMAIPALPVTTPAGLNADSNRWQNMTIQATHAFTAAAGSNNVLDNVVATGGEFVGDGRAADGTGAGSERSCAGMDGAECCRDAGVERCAAGADGDGCGRRGDGGDIRQRARAGMGSVWGERAGCLQRVCTAQANAAVNCERSNRRCDCDGGRSRLLGDDDGEPECGGNVGYGGAGEPDRRTEYDVLCRKSAEGQRRIHGLERGKLGELWNTIGWRRRNAAGRRHLRGAGRKRQSRVCFSGGSISGHGLWREDPGVRECGECELWRDVRRAELHGQLLRWGRI